MPNEWMRNQLREAVASLAVLPALTGIVLAFIAGCSTTVSPDRTEVAVQETAVDDSQSVGHRQPLTSDSESGAPMPDYRVLHPESEPVHSGPERATPEPSPDDNTSSAPDEQTARTPVVPKPDPPPVKPAEPARTPAKKKVKETDDTVVVTPDEEKREQTAPAPEPAADTATPVLDEDVARTGEVETGATEKVPLPVVALETLPMTFGEWELDLRSWSSGEVDCVLRSPSIDFFDGYEPSRLLVKILDHAVIVETESAVDLGYEMTGIRLQESTVMPFTAVVKTNNVELRQDARHALDRATEFTLLMGFWPTWPQKGTREISVPMEGLRPAIAALDLCQEL